VINGIAIPGLHSIEVKNDGEVVWMAFYDNALEACENYVRFKDHGDAKNERVITLKDPDGSKITKTFIRIGVKSEINSTR